MLINAVGWVFGRYRMERSTTVVYAGTAEAHGAYHGSSTSTVDYRPIAIQPYTPPQYRYWGYQDGWTRGIDPIKGVFFWERISGKKVTKSYHRPHNNPHYADGYYPA